MGGFWSLDGKTDADFCTLVKAPGPMNWKISCRSGRHTTRQTVRSETSGKELGCAFMRNNKLALWIEQQRKDRNHGS